jgi:hypothetical protein
MWWYCGYISRLKGSPWLYYEWRSDPGDCLNRQWSGRDVKVQLQRSTVAGCLVRCCCVPILLCFFSCSLLWGSSSGCLVLCCLFQFCCPIFRLLVGFGVYVLLYFFPCVFCFFSRGLSWFLTPCCLFYSCITSACPVALAYTGSMLCK